MTKCGQLSLLDLHRVLRNDLIGNGEFQFSGPAKIVDQSNIIRQSAPHHG